MPYDFFKKVRNTKQRAEKKLQGVGRKARKAYDDFDQKVKNSPRRKRIVENMRKGVKY